MSMSMSMYVCMYVSQLLFFFSATPPFCPTLGQQFIIVPGLSPSMHILWFISHCTVMALSQWQPYVLPCAGVLSLSVWRGRGGSPGPDAGPATAGTPSGAPPVGRG